jgi:hypothetical protein
MGREANQLYTTKLGYIRNVIPVVEKNLKTPKNAQGANLALTMPEQNRNISVTIAV